MHETRPDASADETTGSGLRRRSVLKKTGALGAAGLVGTSITTEPAAAAHCFGPDDDNYLQEATKDNETTESTTAGGLSACGEIRLASSTTIAHMETIQDDAGGATHTFYFATDAATQNMTYDEAWDCVDYHRVDLNSDDSDSVIDFCQPKTGSYPSENSDKVDEVWETLAGIALSEISDVIAYSLTGLDVVAAIADALTYTETSSTHQVFEHERGSDDPPANETKVQGTFEVNVPDGSSGYVEVTSETRAAGEAEFNYSNMCDGPYITHEEKFWLYCDYDTANVFTYDPRF